MQPAVRQRIKARLMTSRAEPWQDATAGAFLMGLLHGTYCLGCYWLRHKSTVYDLNGQAPAGLTESGARPPITTTASRRKDAETLYDLDRALLEAAEIALIAAKCGHPN